MARRQRLASFPDSSYLFYALSLFIILLGGILTFPVQDGDSINFLPAAKSWAEGDGLANRVAEIASYTDPADKSQFNYYVPGLPFVLGGLARLLDSKSYRALIEIASLIKAIATCLLAASIEIMCRRNNFSRRHRIKIWMLVFFVAFSISSPFPLTRPELGVLLCSASASLLAVLEIDRKLKNLGLAIIAGCAGLFSVVGGLIGLAILVLYFYRVKTPAKGIATLIAIALLVFQSLLIMILFQTGIGIGSFIHGFSIHASLALSRNDWTVSSLIRNGYWWVPFFGYSYVVFVVTFIKGVATRAGYYSGFRLAPAAAALAALPILFTKLFLATPEASYNFAPFYPVVIIYLLHELATGRYFWESCLGRRFLKASCAASLVPTVYFLICLVVHIESDYRYTRALVEFESALNQFKECRPYITSGLFTLDEQRAAKVINWRFPNEILRSRMNNQTSPKICKLLIVQEINGAYVEELVQLDLPNLKEITSSTDNQTDKSWLTLLMQKYGLIRSPKGYSSRIFVSGNGIGGAY